MRGAEAVVDVDDRKPDAQLASAALQRRAAALGDAVAHRRRHGDHRARNEAGQHAEERAFHAGDGDDHAMPADLVQALHEPPQSGHADVGEQRRRLPGERERAQRFARDGEVRRAAADDRDACDARRRGETAEDRRARGFVVVESVPRRRRQASELARTEARQQQTAVELRRRAR